MMHLLPVLLVKKIIDHWAVLYHILEGPDATAHKLGFTEDFGPFHFKSRWLAVRLVRVIRASLLTFSYGGFFGDWRGQSLQIRLK
jgi:hypothetical protein